ncbi:Cu(I)-responsive transcriptional regulator [Denitrobaculum tricleocarpae]|uniref:Cu(I)-responsive transcriptional regulator n=1 Tax=Denitrobaculum tricleocarpae TaxID=2591009 RepID=A0A545TYR3_9PROT|nr:Cu(I)-responsive transcriptional regulator [Denitrobaculum tricleocarpae]TQV82313.1 Cu(I)-responsive transcriptional regulator [Denitrobaculum tricleocarpae]
MKIGEASELSDLPAKTIRYYEEIGLVQSDRLDNGYRDYGKQQIHKLRFIQRSRSLGFTVEQCRTLLSLYDDPDRSSADVRALAESHLEEIEQKIQELAGMRDTLSQLVKSCQGDHRPDCPILNDLAGSQ